MSIPGPDVLLLTLLSLQPFCRGDLPSAGSYQKLTLLHLHIQTICHCHLHSYRHRPVLETRPPQLLMPGSICCIQLRSQMHLSGPCCWQSQRLEGCFAMHCICVTQYNWLSWEAVFCLAQAAPDCCESEQSLSTEPFCHTLHPFMGVLLMNSNSRGNIKPTTLPLGPFAFSQTFFPDCYPDIVFLTWYIWDRNNLKFRMVCVDFSLAFYFSGLRGDFPCDQFETKE